MKFFFGVLVLLLFAVISHAQEHDKELEALLYENLNVAENKNGLTGSDLLDNFDNYQKMTEQYQRYQNMMELIQLQTMVDSVAEITMNLNDPSYGDNHAKLVEKKVDNELWYVSLLCLLSVLSLTVALQFLKLKDYTPKDVINITGLTLIIFGTIILVLVVDTSEQLTAAIGILGAVAGYLFRSAQEGPEPSKSNK